MNQTVMQEPEMAMKKKPLTIEFSPNPREKAAIKEIMNFCLEMGITISPAQALRSLVTFGIEAHAKKDLDLDAARASLVQRLKSLQ